MPRATSWDHLWASGLNITPRHRPAEYQKKRGRQMAASSLRRGPYRLLKGHDDHAVGAKPSTLGGRHLLVVLAGRKRRDARRIDPCAEYVIANGRRTIDRELEVRVFFPDGIGMTDYLDIHKPALPGAERVIQLGFVRLVQP